MKNRIYIVRLNHIYGIGTQGAHGTRTRILTGMFITNNRCTSVIDSRGHFFAYQKLAPESYFDVFLEGRWHNKYSSETEEIMDRHWIEDNL
jgi:hypothetical protein